MKEIGYQRAMVFHRMNGEEKMENLLRSIEQ